MIGGFTSIWTPGLPLPLLDLLARAGLLDMWLIADLLAASGMLGAAGVAAQAGRERIAGVAILAAVSAISLTVAVTGGGWLPAGYGMAYAAALMVLRTLWSGSRCAPARRETAGRLRLGRERGRDHRL
ncbi:hypothetical protein [Nonomuraea rhodomycinica]|uniref:Uncharacterized protein n=1 Tax=Nonomuraea rhodomycinica TaxID=1712872 RepID=A0A7Y6MES4_9ACTN|nr:hypothetical protein [Nonomuraea rhodomycinica]NUW44029.1 hypothetical protein [Nonomuraea rhodomycinica]